MCRFRDYHYDGDSNRVKPVARISVLRSAGTPAATYSSADDAAPAKKPPTTESTDYDGIIIEAVPF